MPSFLEQCELNNLLRPAANTLRSSLLSSTGSSTSSSSISSDKYRKPSRAPRFEPRPIELATDSNFARYSKQVAELVDRNQDMKKRAEAKKAAKPDKGKQRATELPLSDKHRAPSRTRSEELVDRTNVSTGRDSFWEQDLDEASLMDVDPHLALERTMVADEDMAPPSLPKTKAVAAGSFRTKPLLPAPVAMRPQRTSTRTAPGTNPSRSVSMPRDVSKACMPAAESPLPDTACHDQTSLPSRVHTSSPPKAPPAPLQPQSTQSRGPRALGMRRANTHASTSSTFRPSQDIPMKQRGFKTPFARPLTSQTAPQYSPATDVLVSNPHHRRSEDASQATNSFPIAENSSTPEEVRGRPARAQPAQSRSPSPEIVPEADSSYGDISFDEDTLNEIMSQYD